MLLLEAKIWFCVYFIYFLSIMTGYWFNGGWSDENMLDVHLMIEHPNNNVQLFLNYLRPGDTVYIHPEAEYHPSTTLQKIIDAGMIPGIAINPGTSIETVYEMLRIVKKVLTMTVNPGNAGQLYMTYVEKKIKRLLKLKDEMGFKTYWDWCMYCG